MFIQYIFLVRCEGRAKKLPEFPSSQLYFVPCESLALNSKQASITFNTSARPSLGHDLYKQPLLQDYF